MCGGVQRGLIPLHLGYRQLLKSYKLELRLQVPACPPMLPTKLEFKVANGELARAKGELRDVAISMMTATSP